jgi:hypothetical protein
MNRGRDPDLRRESAIGLTMGICLSPLTTLRDLSTVPTTTLVASVIPLRSPYWSDLHGRLMDLSRNGSPHQAGQYQERKQQILRLRISRSETFHRRRFNADVSQDAQTNPTVARRRAPAPCQRRLSLWLGVPYRAWSFDSPVKKTRRSDACTVQITYLQMTKTRRLGILDLGG